MARDSYPLGVPQAGEWTERLNTDAALYGGSNYGNFGKVTANAVPHGMHEPSLTLSLPPLGAVFLKAPK